MKFYEKKEKPGFGLNGKIGETYSPINNFYNLL